MDYVSVRFTARDKKPQINGNMLPISGIKSHKDSN